MDLREYKAETHKQTVVLEKNYNKAVRCRKSAETLRLYATGLFAFNATFVAGAVAIGDGVSALQVGALCLTGGSLLLDVVYERMTRINEGVLHARLEFEKNRHNNIRGLNEERKL